MKMQRLCMTVLQIMVVAGLCLLAMEVFWPDRSMAGPAFTQVDPQPRSDTPGTSPSDATTITSTVAITDSALASPLFAEEALTVTAQPSLTISITTLPAIVTDLNGNEEVDPGDTSGYEITYGNDGNADATDVQIVAAYDPSFVQAISAVTADGQVGEDSIAWMLGTLTPGTTQSLRYHATLQESLPVNDGSVETQASIRSVEMTTPATAEHVFAVTAPPELAISLLRAPTLIQDLNGNGQIDPGDTLSYEISYSNRGASEATDVQVIAEYDASVVERITAIDEAGQDDGNQIVWRLPGLGAAQERSLTYDATLKDRLPAGRTNIASQASIWSAEQLSPLSADNAFVVTAQPKLAIKPAQVPDLIDDLNGNRLIDPGDSVRYRFTYRNDGNADATNVQVVADYDDAHIQSVHPDSISAGGSDEQGAITWSLGRVEPGAEAALAFIVLLQNKFPTGETVVGNIITAKSTEFPSPATAEQSFTITAEPLLALTHTQGAPELIKDLDGNDQISPGDTVRYRVGYQNIGSADATNVVLEDIYDKNLIASVDGVSENGVKNENKISWQLATVAPGENGSVTFDAALSSAIESGNISVGNVATIASSQNQPVAVNHSFTVSNAAPEPVDDQSNVEAAGGPFAGVPWVPIVFIGVLAAVAMAVFTYVGAVADYEDGDGANELGRHRVGLVREGTFLIFIISAILILALSDDLAADGAISILSAIVGYVFGRSSSSA